MCGVYPAADVKTAGDEISSTYEGRHLTMREDELKHPVNAGGFVDKGDPVILCLAGSEANFGKAVGVAFNDGAVTSDLIAVDTEGIWAQSVVANTDGPVGSAVVPGDELFINTTTCIISKIRNIATQIPFGYALGNLDAGVTGVIAVKVHFDPTVDSELSQYVTVVSGGYGKSIRATITGASEGICGYKEGHLAGAQTGHLYNFGSWVNIDNGVTGLTLGRIVTPYEGGIYCGEAQATLRAIFAGQHQAILGGVPGTLHAWRFNTNRTVTALIQAANVGSVGYAADGTTDSNKVGDIPFVELPGAALRYIRLYDAPS